jgi:hypothetical protein
MINITCSNSITTVQQDSNLEKNYFNIKGKFYTQGTIFYIFLDNDVYEIPLDKLEVNGSSQATMQDGINALAAILVNAGASGGGGVTNYWDLTFSYVDNINLNLEGYTAPHAGVYRIVGAGDGTYKFELPNVSGSEGQTLTIINSDINIAYVGDSNTAVQYPDGSTFTAVLANGTATFAILSDNIWYVINEFTI